MAIDNRRIGKNELQRYSTIELPQEVQLDMSGSPEFELDVNGAVFPKNAMTFKLVDEEGSDLTFASGQSVPELTMVVNPEMMQFSFAKNIQDEYTRGGHSIEESLANLTSINVSGSTGAFITGESGLNRHYRNLSASYQNLMSLFFIYKNNGTVITNQSLANSSGTVDRNKVLFGGKDIRRIDKVGSVEMTYDGTIYRGSFESFDINEDANMPFRATYSFVFNVRKIFYSAEDLIITTDRSSTFAEQTIVSGVNFVSNLF